jgi:NAD(P)-dependent dehydrogenase (short-subunit alcohol dehydrogenase family)
MLQGKVILVTGAGRGVGRAHALLLAKLGARLVINDLGTDVRGEGSNADPADAVVAEIHSAGGQATANHDDISDWRGAERAVKTGIEVQSKHVSGQVFQTIGGGIAKCAPWTPGPVLWPLNGAARFEPEEIGAALAAAVFGSRFPDLVPPEPPGFSAEWAPR